MERVIVIDGEVELLLDADAQCDLLCPELGEFGVITALRDGYPAYTGETEITPSESIQILQTGMKSVLTDITIQPIPSNYGLITYNGTTITVS